MNAKADKPVGSLLSLLCTWKGGSIRGSFVRAGSTHLSPFSLLALCSNCCILLRLLTCRSLQLHPGTAHHKQSREQQTAAAGSCCPSAPTRACASLVQAACLCQCAPPKHQVSVCAGLGGVSAGWGGLLAAYYGFCVYL